MGRVAPLAGRSDSRKYFETTINFQIVYKLAFRLTPLAPLFTQANFELYGDDEHTQLLESVKQVKEDAGPIIPKK